MLTPDDVRNQRFKERFKGYDVDEVDAFLERAMRSIGELHEELATLRAQLEASSAEEPNELLARTLMTAQRAADETLALAQQDAARLLEDARAEAARMLAEAQQRRAVERQALELETERISRAAESLVRFRTEYRGTVQAVITEQLALLDRTGELPDVPQAVQDLASFGSGLEGPDSALGHDPDPDDLRGLASLLTGDVDDEGTSSATDDPHSGESAG